MITNCNFLKAVTVIFKNLIKEKLDIVFKFIEGNRILVKFTSFALVAVLSLVVSIVACGITFGFNVNYSGKNIAVVSKTAVFDKAKEIVLENVEDKTTAKAIAQPKFAFTITVMDRLDSEKKVADAIIENTDEISCGFAVKVNGEALTYTSNKEIKDYIEAARCRFFVEGAQNTASFVDEVSVESGYYLNSKIEDEQTVKAKIDALQVKTVSTVTSEKAIAYSTKTQNRSDQYVGYTRVVKTGSNGVRRTVEKLETVNGAEAARTLVSSEVVKEPVARVIEQGTKVAYASATEKAQAKAAGFIYPMKRGDVKKVTAYWGDGRGHKGVDLAGDTGSPIFASKEGTVIFAGWDGNYGYSVVIDHGNGFKTRYAHNSALCVKKGATVSQGQQIAKLGNTGRSTGPHLHFEILKNDKQVNPSAYIKF
jgi:murein DD-endopeptidase MepM/ murein hydrolase activator NlpD